MRTTVPLSRVELLPSGRLSLTLRDDPGGWAKYIYRAAAEIEWVPEERRFISPRPELGPPQKHYSHVATAAADECSYLLTPDADTEWVNVPTDERTAMESFKLSSGT
jgi:hypothetical protein